MKVYDEMAEYYDLIYWDQYDIEFYLREAKNARGSVLEVGCGTGRIFLHLLSEGIDAYGIDISQKMLDILIDKAKKKGIENPPVSQGDMLDFKLDKKFNLIILPYRTFLHLKNNDERKKALMNIKKHLEDGGRLILHVYNPSKEEIEMTEEFHHFETEELVSPYEMKYKLDWHMNYESSKSLAHYKVELTLDDGKKFTYSMDIYFLKMKEMEELLKSCGYKNVKAYCGFNYVPFYDDCKEVLWFAEK